MQPLRWLAALAIALAASDLGKLPPEKNYSLPATRINIIDV